MLLCRSFQISRVCVGMNRSTRSAVQSILQVPTDWIPLWIKKTRIILSCIALYQESVLSTYISYKMYFHALVNDTIYIGAYHIIRDVPSPRGHSWSDFSNCHSPFL